MSYHLSIRSKDSVCLACGDKSGFKEIPLGQFFLFANRLETYSAELNLTKIVLGHLWPWEYFPSRTVSCMALPEALVASIAEQISNTLQKLCFTLASLSQSWGCRSLAVVLTLRFAEELWDGEQDKIVFNKSFNFSISAAWLYKHSKHREMVQTPHSC